MNTFVFLHATTSYLRHVPDARTGDLAAGFSRLVPENADISLVRFESSDDAAEKRRLAATTRSQEPVSAERRAGD